MNTIFRLGLSLALCLAGSAAFAQTAPAALPEWDQLTPQQREAVLAPFRDRWNNSSPEDRARMFEHASRWKSMTPEQRAQARRGMHRFEHMSPEQREQARALFGKMRNMTREQREDLRKRWGTMTPEQRREWMETNAPQRDNPPSND